MAVVQQAATILSRSISTTASIPPSESTALPHATVQTTEAINTTATNITATNTTTTVASTCSTQSILFFGTIPVGWEDLTSDQRHSCIGQYKLKCLFGGHHAWVAEGDLLDRWNAQGNSAYTVAITHINRKIKKRCIVSHQFFLLSQIPNRETAIPFVIVKSRAKKTAEEVVSKLEKHPHLCKFGMRYMALEGGIRPSATYRSIIPEVSSGIPLEVSADTNASESSLIDIESLCGAQIEVASDSSPGRDAKVNIATIAGVFRLGQRHYALTAAHAFFDNVDSSGSWADSGLYVTSTSSQSLTQETPLPKISESYDVVLKNVPKNVRRANDVATTTITSVSLGPVIPSVLHRRRNTLNTALPEVVLDAELD
ncbi:hypothetical protein MMC10_004033 [Thelotrema lepadinum]|nr:hypothetical protein [Thelotrema lepadinum]